MDSWEVESEEDKAKDATRSDGRKENGLGLGGRGNRLGQEESYGEIRQEWSSVLSYADV